MPLLPPCARSLLHFRSLSLQQPLYKGLLAGRLSCLWIAHPQRRACLSNCSPTRRNDDADKALPFQNDPNVHVHSLQETLEAHRDANRSLLIRKHDGAGKFIPLSQSLPEQHRLGDSKQKRDQVHAPSRSVRLKREHIFNRRGKSRTSDYMATRPAVSRQWQAKTSVPKPLQWPWLYVSGLASQLQDGVAAVDRLGAEIRAFENYQSPTSEERAAADRVVEEIKALMQSVPKEYTVKLIGSRASGLAGPLSDIDLNLEPVSAQKFADHAPESSRVLKKLHTDLRKGRVDPAFRTILIHFFIQGARVPIIDCTHKATALDFQIQSTTESLASLEYTKSYLAEFPTLRGLFKVVKQMLNMRGLCDGSQGGITSYPLLIMIVAALRFSEGKVGPSDIGGQLLYFLDMYATLDFYDTCISMVPLDLVAKRKRQSRRNSTSVGEVKDDPVDSPAWQPYQNESWDKLFRVVGDHHYKMVLQDPANLFNDLGKAAYFIKDIQATFAEARDALVAIMRQWDGERAEGGRDHPPSPRALLAPCVGGDYTLYQHARRDLRMFARTGMES